MTMEIVDHHAIDRFRPPSMPVLCTECRHAVLTSVAGLCQCVTGIKTEVRVSDLYRLCEDFQPLQVAS